MSTRVGLGVGRGSVRAVAIRRQRIVWAGEAPLTSSEALQATITTLLAQAPLPRWPKPVVHAAIGPHGAQVKRVIGLPEIGDADALAAIIREAVGTYFLKNGVPLLTTSVRPIGAGAAVAAALDRPYVDAIRAACLARGLRLGPIAPTAVALTHAFVDPSFCWNDGSLTIEASRTLDLLRTRPARREDHETPALTVVPMLAGLGESSLWYADAFGAATLDPHEPLSVQSEAGHFLSFAAPRRSLVQLSAIAALALFAVGLSPLAAKWAGNRATANIARLRPGRWKVITTTLGNLDRVSAVLNQARSFGDSRTSVSRLLGEVARLLPGDSAVLEFEWLGDHGEITVLARDPSAVLAGVRRLPNVRTVELLGSITRQSAGGRDLQRVTIRFVRAS